MPVRVTFDVRAPETHLVKVTLQVPATAADERTFRMAAWVPGSYKIRDFGRHVQDLKAHVAGKPAPVRQDGKDSWRVRRTRGKRVRLEYDVYCRELTVDTSHVTGDHAHLFPATLILYDDSSRPQPHEVKILAPRGWRAWSGLETPALDGTLAAADDYDHVIDCPIEVGPPADYDVSTFKVRGKPHRVVTWKPPGDMAQATAGVKAIVNETAKIFGGLPYEHYTFLSHVALGHGGGLEHRNSTVLGVDPLHLVSKEKLQTNYYPLVSHEFFHTWNVKRIQPAAFRPYDLQREVYTDLLWLFEGFTSYYELPILARAGVVDAEHWGKVVAEMLTYYEKAIGRRRRPVGEASRLTWTLLYQPHEHNVNRNVSYYTKGLFVGLCLDAELRRRGVRDGLDVVMRHLWRHHATGPGLAEEGFAAAVKEATGKDLRAKLRSWTAGTTELPIDAALRSLGWTVKREAKDPKKPLGLNVHFRADSSRIERIPEDAPAWKVLQPDDEIVAVDGYQWKAERFGDWIAHKDEGDEVEVHLFREGRLRSFAVPLTTMPKDKISVKPTKGRAAARKRWLGAFKA